MFLAEEISPMLGGRKAFSFREHADAESEG